MSTAPTVIATEQALPVLFTAREAEAAGGFDSIRQMMDNFDPATLLPGLSSVTGLVTTVARLAVIIGPILLLALGAAYLLAAPKEANYSFGYRCYHGMGSVEAWRYTQRMAGLIWAGLGAVLTIVMFITTAAYGGKELITLIDSAVTSLIWELVLTVVSCIAINGFVVFHFDRNGSRRRR